MGAHIGFRAHAPSSVSPAALAGGLVSPSNEESKKLERNKCIVFVQRTLPVGGIETLIVRIAKKLLENLGDVVVCGTHGEMSGLLPSNVDFFPVNGYVDLIRRLPGHLKRRYKHHNLILVSMHPHSLLAAYALRYWLGSNCVQSFHLVTHPRAFFFSKKFPFFNYLRKSGFFRAPQASTYFMNDASLKAHQSEWRMDLSGYPIIRLPLNAVAPTWEPKTREGLRVVSVGRLVAFKAYNHSSPSIARKLIDSGVNFTWDIYGDGQDRDGILREIERHGVKGAVNLKGHIPYTDFFKTIGDYDVFIGMGTSLLEAAQLGMPSICAIDCDGDYSYGLFYDAPSDSIGEIVANHPKTQIIDILTYLNGLQPMELKSIGLKCAESALRRSNDESNFIDAILNSSCWHLGYSIKNLALLFCVFAFFIFFDIRYRIK